MATNWTRSQRKRHKEETALDIKPDVRTIFLTPTMKAKRKRQAAQVAYILAGKRKR